MKLKAYHGLMKAVRAVVTGILVVDVVIVVAQVFFRFVLKNPLGWSEQICRLLFLWAIMLGIPVVFYEKCDLVFDILFEKFPPKLQKIMSCVFALISIGFCVFYFIAGMSLCIKTGARMTAGVKMPLNVLYGAQPVCAALLLLVFIERLIKAIRPTPAEKEGD